MFMSVAETPCITRCHGQFGTGGPIAFGVFPQDERKVLLLGEFSQNVSSSIEQYSPFWGGPIAFGALRAIFQSHGIPSLRP